MYFSSHGRCNEYAEVGKKGSSVRTAVIWW